MTVCPVCRLVPVEVTAPGPAGKQFICGCPNTTWAYRANGDLDRLDGVSGSDAVSGVGSLRGRGGGRRDSALDVVAEGCAVVGGGHEVRAARVGVLGGSRRLAHPHGGATQAQPLEGGQ